MYDLGLVLIGRNLDLLVAGPSSLAGLALFFVHHNNVKSYMYLAGKQGHDLPA